MKQQKYILISGTFRSGTSLLCACLNTHPAITIAWQPYWLFFKACSAKFLEIVNREPRIDYPMGLLRVETLREQEILEDIFNVLSFDKRELDLLIKKIKTDLSSNETKINTGMKNEGLCDYLDNLEVGSAGYILSQLFARFYQSCKEIQKESKYDIQIVGTKEVFCEEYLSPFLNYKDLQSAVIHIIRDPRAVVASRNYGKYMKATESKYPLFFIIRSWKRSVENYLKNKQKDNYLMMRYEDLVCNPGLVLSRACDFLKIKYSNKMIDFTRFKDSRGHNWKANSSFENPQSINTASVSKWQEILSPQEIEVIEYFCREEMELLGYKCSFEKLNQQRVLAYRDSPESITRWLRNYDFGAALKKDT